MSLEGLADFDKEVIRTRSDLKDFISGVFQDLVFPYVVSVDIPILGKHRLSMDDKRKMLSFTFEAIDGASPLELLALRKRFEKFAVRGRK